MELCSDNKYTSNPLTQLIKRDKTHHPGKQITCIPYHIVQW